MKNEATIRKEILNERDIKSHKRFLIFYMLTMFLTLLGALLIALLGIFKLEEYGGAIYYLGLVIIGSVFSIGCFIIFILLVSYMTNEIHRLEEANE